MSILLKKALKISITPAILMIAGKFLGIIILIMIYNFQFDVGNEITGIFSTQLYLSDDSTTLFVNSISDLSMILLLSIPTLYMIIQTTIIQNAASNPRTIAKVVKFNVLKWVTSGQTTFLRIFIWTSFVIISSSVVIVNSLKGSTYMWIGIISGTISLFCVWGLIKTFEIETNKVYPNNNKHSYY